MKRCASHKLSKFAMVKTKRAYRMLPNAHRDEWCILTNYIACCINAWSTTCINIHPLISWLIFRNNSIRYLILLIMYLHICQICFIMENVYIFEWYSCQLLIVLKYLRHCMLCSGNRIQNRGGFYQKDELQKVTRLPRVADLPFNKTD